MHAVYGIISNRNEMIWISYLNNCCGEWVSVCVCVQRFLFYSSAAADSSSACSRCGNLGCFRRDETFFTFGFGVVVGGFSNSSNCLSVKIPLYQSALKTNRKIVCHYIWTLSTTSKHNIDLDDIRIEYYHSGTFRAHSHFFETSSNAWPSLHPFRRGCSPFMHT